MGLTPVPAGRLAAIVTSLEMKQAPRPRALPASRLRLVPWREPAPERYRALFRRVGAPWLWFSRLLLDDRALGTIIGDPHVAVFAAADPAGVEIGLLELDFRVAGECELAFLGLVPELAGRGEGGWLMAHALTLAWRRGVTRVWVHTCTLDHPAALGFYRKHGFTAFRRQIETFADPRLAGILPRDAAPQIPLIEA